MAKHNKKRNTAFIFEALSHEMTQAIVSKDDVRRQKIVKIVRHHFKKGTELRKELDLFQALSENYGTKDEASKILQEAKSRHSKVNREKLFSEQTKLINRINKELSKGVFSNFVGNYKDLATIYKVFNDDTPIKEKILLEEVVVSSMVSDSDSEKMKPVDGVVYSTFVKKFNEEYSRKLPTEQKELLNRYVSSVSDNGLEFKFYLNEEIGRLKKRVQESLEVEEIKADLQMTDSTKRVFKILEDLSEEPLGEEVVKKVMSVQNFILEVDS